MPSTSASTPVAPTTPDIPSSGAIRALDGTSVHRITSGQVVVDLQTAVKELLENSLDAGATNVEVRFKDYGLQSFEVVDNGSGIAPEDYDAIALKHHTSKLSSFADLNTLTSFGFRGEALSSLCALSERVSITTATARDAPMGTVLEFDRAGRVARRDGKAARQRGTTVTVSGLFSPLPVRRKELERNAKREFGKALALLSAYALVPCAQENRGVRLTVSNQPAGGRKTVQLRTDGAPSTRSSVSALWGPRTLEQLVDLDVHFRVMPERAVLRRRGVLDGDDNAHANEVRVRGLVSKFAVGCGRASTDRQFFFVNGRPCNPSKVQKAFNEVYRSFNATQAPFIVADFILPTDSCDVNVSPDKRTILLHSEANLVQALKTALEETFAPARATYDVKSPFAKAPHTQSVNATEKKTQEPANAKAKKSQDPLFFDDEQESNGVTRDAKSGIERAGAAEVAPAGRSAGQGSPDEEMDRFGEPSLLLTGESSKGSAPETTGESEDVQVPWAEEEAAVQTAQESRMIANVTSTSLVPETSAADEHSMSILDEIDEQTFEAAAQCVNDSLAHGPPEEPALADTSTHRRSSPAAQPATYAKRPASCALDRAGERTDGTVQTALGTVGETWDLHCRAEGPSGPPSKKRRIDSGKGLSALAAKAGKQGRAAREDLRERLRGFARTGSQTVDVPAADGDVEMDDEEALEMRKGDQTDDAQDGSREEMTPNERPDSDPAVGRRSEDDMGAEDDGTDEEGDEDIVLPTPDFAQRRVIDLTQGDADGDTSQEESRSISPTVVVSPSPGTSSSRVSHAEVLRTEEGEGTTLRVDLSRIAASWRRLQDRLATTTGVSSKGPRPVLEPDAGVSNADNHERAVEALSRVIDKSDFASMEVIGQFNLGFIIARRRKSIMHNSESGIVEGVEGDSTARDPIMDDLFIIDQHAADEKYNFETLQQTTKIESQRLYRPQPLELTAADELLAAENIDVLRQNGFEVEIDEIAAPGQGSKLKLVAQPISKNTVFDMKDLEELLHLMQDQPTGHMVRCSKARAMFAMRACRKSFMVGMPLNRQQMTLVVRHMGTMDQPWHCPHGRPTMRHLFDMIGAGWDPRPRQREKGVEWDRFGN
ncbi:DNA mismatch repair protein MutL [Obba rivulosa]|uniref:DNA mismatch repair protein PMS1 n=1 Tax=Obba rivulosa TaxID=1052685 RepID=A0A8E2AWG3_9APHY|nr:DNA mismatch repair protein MutL [Obba rivulosa]